MDHDRRMELAREWDGLVEQVRTLDGFADFLRPPRAPDLLAAGADGPVVVVNVSQWRCDALIVDGDVRSVPLPLTAEDVAERTGRYLDAVDADPVREDVVTETLGWLWDAVAGPVLDALGLTGTAPPWPRVWWCPTGLLTLLPLHAAGHHGEPGRAVLDRAVSSYTPTLRALLDARAPRPLPPERMLAVAVPDPDGGPALPGAGRDVAYLREVFPPDRITVLDGASPGAVLAELGGHRWAHFSCHGDQNLTDPARGGLLLDGGTLTVTDIAARGRVGEFAFLSACKTATGGRTLPDEAITLAAALHHTGYRQVIATLWSVPDRVARRVVRGVYGRLTERGAFDPSGAAAALHETVRELRALAPDRPAAWTPFTHLGP